ncbi:MAG: winged helix-turn-helix domain-containing protein [Abitibacteriaceae bacterium]|nr:winged helix-turn-helix domain-containing protein [Abditibacteriaceae bacterium]
MASILGVRRAGITVAAGTLREAGLIEYSRGAIHLLNRPGLEACACECCHNIRTQLQLYLNASC